ncbi:hypothetical protein C8J56DRAFT_1001776 [Mycena floridula]|nr:hypothetical protein C8J56DRAFT_1001776 [Mycena floridula]
MSQGSGESNIGTELAGRANDAKQSIAETRPYELAIECPACPNPKVNLPADWVNATGQRKDRLLYIMFIAVDACFRLKHKIVLSDFKDPGLGTGFSYFVEDEPYHEYVKTLGDQEEINTCTGLLVVDHANTQFSHGYAVTGVGLALCARHEFGNMTYVLASFLRHVLKELPALVRFKVVLSLFQWVIPKLHILGHKVACQLAFNLNYMLGAARMDGEGVERPWANIGPVATSTREMGPGHHHDTLDDHWHDWNWRKIIGLTKLLLCRLEEASEELVEQEEAFRSFSSNQLEEVLSWRAMVKAWEADPENNKNPYEPRKSSIMLQKVCLELSVAEATLARAGMPGLHKCSPAEFLLRGMDIEEQQRRLSQEVHLLGPTPMTKQTADLNNKRNKVMWFITRLRSVQVVYMPGTVQLLNDLQTAETGKVIMAEDMRILLPLDLTEAQRSRGGVADGITDLLIKAQLLTYKHHNVRHQGMLTRTRTLLNRNDEKAAWEAKLKLVNGNLDEVRWKKLAVSDVKPMRDVEETKKEMQKR